MSWGRLAEAVRSSSLAAWLGAAFFALLTSVSLIVVDRLVLLVRAGGNPGLRGMILNLRALDIGLLAACGVVFAACAWLEIRGRRFSRLLQSGPMGPLFVLLISALIWFSHALMAPGLLVTGDAGSHVARIAHLMAAIRDGSSLIWDNDFFIGGPLLTFTGPVFHWSTTALGLVVGDATTGVKALTVFLRLASAGLMFAYLRKLGLGVGSACVGAVFYGGDFAQTYLFSVRSTFPQVVNLACLPAIFLSLEQIIRLPRDSRAGWCGLVLATVLLIGNHQPTAAVTAIYVAFYTMWRLTALGWPRPVLLQLMSAGAAILVASVYFVVPFMLEKSWTADDFSVRIINLQWPYLWDMVRWGASGTGASYACYLGLSVVGCGLSGIWALGRGQVPQAVRGLWRFFGVMLLISLFLTGAYVREIIFTLFFMCIWAALAVQGWVMAAPRYRAVPVFVLAVFLVDMGPLAVQPWVRPDLDGLARAGDVLAVKAAGQRVLEVVASQAMPEVPIGPSASPLLYARVQSVFGPHKMDATKAHNALVATAKLAQADFARTGTLGATAQGLLASYNVGWVVATHGGALGLPPNWPATAADAVLGRVDRIDAAWPLLTSGALLPVKRPASFDEVPLWNKQFPAGDAFKQSLGYATEQDVLAVWGQMGVDSAAHKARAFLMPIMPQGKMWQYRGPAPSAVLADYHVGQGDVHLAVRMSGPGFIRLAHPVFPMLQVRQDGQLVQPGSDVFSLTVLPVHEGLNIIDIRARWSVMRQVCFAVTCACLLALVMGLAARWIGRLRHAER